LITDAFDFKARTLGNTRYCKPMRPRRWGSVDIGPDSSAAFAAIRNEGREDRTGTAPCVFEVEKSAQGTSAIAKALAEATAAATTIVGGGDLGVGHQAAAAGRRCCDVSIGERRSPRVRGQTPPGGPGAHRQAVGLQPEGDARELRDLTQVGDDTQEGDPPRRRVARRRARDRRE
jgi:hypothetical protein